MSNVFEIPAVVLDRYDELVDLVENRSVDRAHLAVKDLAAYYRMSEEYIRGCIKSGKLPFAFAPESGRAVSYVGVLPFYLYETQGGVVMLQNGLRKK